MTVWILLFCLIVLLLTTTYVYDGLVSNQHATIQRQRAEIADLTDELNAATRLLDYAVFTNQPPSSPAQLRLVRDRDEEHA